MQKWFILCGIPPLLAACLSGKAQFDFPDAMLPHVKEEYTRRCNKGKRLYELNCAGCHNVRQGRRSLIPEFEQEKLRGYALRVSNTRHVSSMPDTLVSEEELVLISDFLLYRKKTGSSATP